MIPREIRDPVGELIQILEMIETVDDELMRSEYTDEQIKKARKRAKKEYKLLKEGNIQKSKYLNEEAKDLYDWDKDL